MVKSGATAAGEGFTVILMRVEGAGLPRWLKRKDGFLIMSTQSVIKELNAERNPDKAL
jgi:hypothetical protein